MAANEALQRTAATIADFQTLRFSRAAGGGKKGSMEQWSMEQCQELSQIEPERLTMPARLQAEL
jgi:hypothetical protein